MGFKPIEVRPTHACAQTGQSCVQAWTNFSAERLKTAKHRSNPSASPCPWCKVMQYHPPQSPLPRRNPRRRRQSRRGGIVPEWQWMTVCMRFLLYKRGRNLFAWEGVVLKCKITGSSKIFIKWPLLIFFDMSIFYCLDFMRYRLIYSVKMIEKS